ncbi:hypothetical protein, partial [Microcoleus sp. Pol12B4]|uniref:hypothetical protein n=1 Tax=Microcoleus sp. Pol12B4 TaxID=3055395 RepID=UPI002FD4A216
LFIFTFNYPLMSSFFPTQLLPPATISRRGLCQLQVLLAADRHQASPLLMPPLKIRFFDKTRFVRSFLISALIAIGYYSRAIYQTIKDSHNSNFRK